MHDAEFDHEHEEISDDDRAQIARAIREQDTVELTTVGIDIGSSTSHLMFARVVLQRLAEALSSRFVVIERAVLWRSPILLTPFLPDGTIDAGALQAFLVGAYAEAGLRPEDVDGGAVILTGEAIKRSNARAIDELFAAEAGKFVCATAGHRLECILAAHGSGAVGFSRRRGRRGLHVDIGGGTTKLALIDKGEVLSVSAFAVGGRLVAQDAAGAWTRIDDAARLGAADLGIDATPGGFDSAEVRRSLAKRLAQVVIDRITGAPMDALGQALQLTEPLDRTFEPDFVTVSGGVAEYIFGHEVQGHGDIAADLAQAVVERMRGLSIPLVEPSERIRATVIGASQFTVQVSGKTIHLPDPSALPARNLPVVRAELDLSGEIDVAGIAEAFVRGAARMDQTPHARLALAFSWHAPPEYLRLEAVARAVAIFAAPAQASDPPLFLIIDGDVGGSLGRLISRQPGFDRQLVAIDGVNLQHLDYVDIGEVLQPSGVAPVVIKSLLFS
ncbi:ethanolamine ammonia-lyase reactivating factor EutA [Caulobacter sp. S45]|uniref:ethanolamine ammonia-lyase reactivating factor EutA n=1 Tax=Caulobacter sp. S45 TaxID=1641861 RepID=UPI001C206952|nr:ethanolamine ammonia-lyase reactivating factor EutA [Caulobacter sp. S45]